MAKALPPPLMSPLDVVALLAKIARASQEEFWVVPVDARHRPLKRAMVARGTLNRCEVHPRDVFRIAVEANAAAVIVAHNHPSGDVTPSADDRTLTRRLVEAGALLGIPVLDQVIVGQLGSRLEHYSFATAGELAAARAA
jgi:DNA repair protein RadC